MFQAAVSNDHQEWKHDEHALPANIANILEIQLPVRKTVVEQITEERMSQAGILYETNHTENTAKRQRI